MEVEQKLRKDKMELEERKDIVGELYKRGLHSLVEKILANTDARTVAVCHQVCRCWMEELQRGEVWRRLTAIEMRANPGLVRLGISLGWPRHTKVERWAAMQKKETKDSITHLLEEKELGLEESPLEVRMKQVEEDLVSNDGEDKQRRDEKEKRGLWRKMLYMITNHPAPNSIHSPIKVITGGLYSALHLHGECFFTGMLDGLIKMWELATPSRPLRVLEGHEERVTCFSSNRDTLASGSLDHTVRLWSCTSGAMLRVLSTGEVAALKMEPGFLAWVTSSGSLQKYTWDGETPYKCLPHLRVKLGFRPDPSLLALGSNHVVAARRADRELAVYCLNTGHRLPDCDVVCGGELVCVALTGSLLAIAWGATVEVWSLAENSCLAVISSSLPGYIPSQLCLTDYMLLVFLPSGLIFHWPTVSLVSPISSPLNLPLHSPPATIEGGEPLWPPPCLSKGCLVVGSAARLGDLRVWRWSLSRKASSFHLFRKLILCKGSF